MGTGRDDHPHEPSARASAPSGPARRQLAPRPVRRRVARRRLAGGPRGSSRAGRCARLLADSDQAAARCGRGSRRRNDARSVARSLLRARRRLARALRVPRRVVALGAGVDRPVRHAAPVRDATRLLLVAGCLGGCPLGLESVHVRRGVAPDQRSARGRIRPSELVAGTAFRADSARPADPIRHSRPATPLDRARRHAVDHDPAARPARASTGATVGIAVGLALAALGAVWVFALPRVGGARLGPRELPARDRSSRHDRRAGRPHARRVAFRYRARGRACDVTSRRDGRRLGRVRDGQRDEPPWTCHRRSSRRRTNRSGYRARARARRTGGMGARAVRGGGSNRAGADRSVSFEGAREATQPRKARCRCVNGSRPCCRLVPSA